MATIRDRTHGSGPPTSLTMISDTSIYKALPPTTPKKMAPMTSSHHSTVPWTHRLGTRLALVLGAASSLLLLGLGAFSVSMYLDERAARLNELAERARTLTSVLEQVDTSGKRNIERLYAVFDQLAPAAALSWAQVGDLSHLTLRGQKIEGDYSLVDLFAQRTGGVATVFQREGDDFRRISTSLTKEDGSRAVGTMLGQQHPAYRAMMEGQRYVGRATLFGRHYMTVYQPVKIDDEVAAILFIGYDLSTEMGVVDKLLKSLNGDRLLAAALDVGQGAAAGTWLGRDLPRLQADDALMNALRERLAAGQTGGVLERDELPGFVQQQRTNIAWQAYTPWNWVVLVAERDADTTEATRYDLMFMWGVVLGTGVLVMALLTWFVRHRVVRPLIAVQDAIAQLAQGRLQQTLPRAGQDEFGALLTATETMRRKWLEVVQRVRQASTVVAAGAGEIAQGNQNLSERTERTTTSLEQTAASLARLAEAVRQGADTARTANQVATQAADSARRGGQEVQQAVASMRAMEVSSQRIADITGVIDSIAFQTNILALNAAVEAARAGEAGRGFAVVAGEVRSLAQRSAEAARQIKTLIEESVAAVRAGSQQVQHSGATIAEVVQAIQRVADLIGEVSAATSEQSDNVAQVNAAMEHLDQMTQQNAVLVEQAMAAASSLHEQAQALLQALQAFDVAAASSVSPAADS